MLCDAGLTAFRANSAAVEGSLLHTPTPWQPSPPVLGATTTIFLDCNLKKQPCIDLVFLLRPSTEADFVTLALAAFYLKRLSNSTAYILNSVLKVLLFKNGILVNSMMMMSLKRESPNVSTPKESRGTALSILQGLTVANQQQHICFRVPGKRQPKAVRAGSGLTQHLLRVSVASRRWVPSGNDIWKSSSAIAYKTAQFWSLPHSPKTQALWSILKSE